MLIFQKKSAPEVEQIQERYRNQLLRNGATLQAELLLLQDHQLQDHQLQDLQVPQNH